MDSYMLKPLFAWVDKVSTYSVYLCNKSSMNSVRAGIHINKWPNVWFCQHIINYIHCNRLMLGFGFVGWFLSMWISNTATIAMLLPIVEVVIETLKTSTVTDAESGMLHIMYASKLCFGMFSAVIFDGTFSFICHADASY